MPTLESETELNLPEESQDNYPDGEAEAGTEKEDELMLELTMEELKEAFRIFDNLGDGFITILRFREILMEIDEDFTDDEIDGIIFDTDLDKSETIDFDEFVKLMA